MPTTNFRTGDRVRGADWLHEIAGAVGTVVRAVEVNGDDWAAQDLLVRFDRPVVIVSEPQWTFSPSAHNFEFVDESRAALVRQGPGLLHAYVWACAVCRSCSQAHALAKCSASPYFCARLCVAHKNARPAWYTKRRPRVRVSPSCIRPPTLGNGKGGRAHLGRAVAEGPHDDRGTSAHRRLRHDRGVTTSTRALQALLGGRQGASVRGSRASFDFFKSGKSSLRT